MIEIAFFSLIGLYVLWMIFTAFSNGFGKGFLQSVITSAIIVGVVYFIFGANWISAFIILGLLLFKPNFIFPDFGKPPSLK